MRLLMTGGCGFIGSAVVRHVIRTTDHSVINVDKMTYAASEEALEEGRGHNRHTLVRADIADHAAMREVFATHQPDLVMHLVAETHVDRSIDGPGPFIQSNVVGTYCLLDVALEYWRGLPADRKAAFRFHHISTDEVFGALGKSDPPFTETTAYDPRSPYSASKAASDHLVRAWHHTYGLPTIVSNTVNNYGPWQFPEKRMRRSGRCGGWLGDGGREERGSREPRGNEKRQKMSIFFSLPLLFRSLSLSRNLKNKSLLTLPEARCRCNSCPARTASRGRGIWRRTSVPGLGTRRR